MQSAIFNIVYIYLILYSSRIMLILPRILSFYVFLGANFLVRMCQYTGVLYSMVDITRAIFIIYIHGLERFDWCG